MSISAESLDNQREATDCIRSVGVFPEPGGGFVFNTVHNIQARTPVENVVAMVEALRE